MLSDIRCYRPREVSMRLTARIALIVGVIVAASTLPAVGQQGPIRIGASLSLTGSYAKLGGNQHEGYKLCERDLNAKGGLLGRKVEFVVYDDQSAPPTAVRLYEKLITEDRVDGVMGPYSSPVTEAAANVTEQHKQVMVSPLAATAATCRSSTKRSSRTPSTSTARPSGSRACRTRARRSSSTPIRKSSATSRRTTRRLATRAASSTPRASSAPAALTPTRCARHC